MFAVTTFIRHQTSEQSLHELEERLASNASATIDLAEYANKRVEELLQQAATLAQQLHQPQISEAILLASLTEHPRIRLLLARLEHGPDQLSAAIRSELIPDPRPDLPPVTLSPEARQRLLHAFELAVTYNFPYIDLEDLFLSFAASPGKWQDLLKQFDLDEKSIYNMSRWFSEEQEQLREWRFWTERGRTRPKGFMNKAWTALPTPFLDQYSVDITSSASLGAAHYASVREEYVQRALEVLGGTERSSVIIVGEPGVGKSTILQSIAVRMVEEKVPEVLRDKRLVQVDIANLLSSSENPEGAVTSIINEITSAGNVILAVPDIQTIAGTAGNALNAATLFGNALNRGDLHIISTATYADYHRFIETNSQLSNQLTIIEIPATTHEETIRILEDEAGGIEQQQGVLLTFPALEAAASLAERYITSAVTPSSALTLLSESASRARLAGKKWVVKEDVEASVQKFTGVPVGAASEAEADQLLHLEDKLHERVVGQYEAIVAVANALRRSRAGFHKANRPIASFMFVGPTGVGKTELAKALADIFFGNEQAFVRLDMSEYQEPQAVYQLIGAPASSSESFTEGGTLTRAVREHSYCLLLLDEIEKAHPDVLNLFLQLLDDARLRENTGRTVSFQNCIIVATSNAQAQAIAKLIDEKVNPQELPKQIIRLLQSNFKPEFLNRFDGIIPFHPLTQEEIAHITELLLKGVTEQAAAQGITVSYTPEAIQKLASIGFDPVFGARPLRRVIQDKVEGLLAEQVLSHQIQNGDTFQITAEMIQ